MSESSKWSNLRRNTFVSLCHFLQKKNYDFYSFRSKKLYQGSILLKSIISHTNVTDSTNHVGHSHIINSIVKLSKDKFATGSYDKTIKIWNANSFGYINTLVSNDSSVTCLAKVLKSKNQLLSGYANSLIRLWNYDDAICVKTFNIHSRDVLCIASINANYFISSGEEKIVYKTNLQTGLVENQIKTYEVSKIVKTSESHVALYSSQFQKFCLWNTNESKIEEVPKSLDIGVKTCIERLSNNCILTGGLSVIDVFYLQGNKILSRDVIQLNTHSKTSIDFLSKIDKNSVVVSFGGSFLVFNLKDWSFTQVYNFPESRVRNELTSMLTIANHIVCPTRNNNVCIIPLEKDQEVKKLTCTGGNITNLLSLSDDTILAFGEDNVVKCYNTKANKWICNYYFENKPISCILQVTDNKIMVGTMKGSIILFSLSQGKILDKILITSDEVFQITKISQHDYMVVSRNRNLFLNADIFIIRIRKDFKFDHSFEVRKLTTEYMQSFVHLGDNLIGIAASTYLKTIELDFDKKKIETRKCLDHQKVISCIAKTNNLFLLSGGCDGNIKKWNSNTGQYHFTFQTDSTKVIGLYNLTNFIFLSCTEAGRLIVWDLLNNSSIKTIQLKYNNVRAVCPLNLIHFAYASSNCSSMIMFEGLCFK